MTNDRARHSERGASILELALIAPVMVLLVMGVIDLARGYQMQIRLENAAREGAAFAQLDPNFVTCGTTGNIEDRALSEDEGMNADIRVFAEDASGDFTDEILGCTGETRTVESGERVLVEASATFDVLVPMVERVVGSEIELTGSAEIEVQG